MTAQDLVQYVKRRLIGMSGADGKPWNEAEWADKEPEVWAGIPAALQAVAAFAAADPSLDGLLTQNYSVTLSSGVGALLTATGSITSATDISLQRLPFLMVKDNSNNVLRYMKSFQDLNLPAATDVGYYCVVNQQIHTRAVAVAVQGPPLTGASSPLIVTAHFIPQTVPAVPAELTPALEDLLVGVVTNKQQRVYTAAAEYGVAMQPAA